MTEVLLTLTETATQTRISARHLDRLIATGKGPRVTCVGQRRLVRESDYQAWLDANARPADDAAA